MFNPEDPELSEFKVQIWRARAVAYARFNARLNQIETARFEVGDLAEPVMGERFDHVISQPPFVTQPPAIATTTYLHGGPRGDELSLRLLAQLPAQAVPIGMGCSILTFALRAGAIRWGWSVAQLRTT